MKTKIRYTNEPINSRPTRDIFPSPEELMRSEEKQRVTLELTKSSLDYFKNVAQKNNASYQVMIRRLVDFYANNRHKNFKPFKFASA
jgi:hypothetical protein